MGEIRVRETDSEGDKAVGLAFMMFLLSLFAAGFLITLESTRNLVLNEGQTLSSRLGVAATTLFCLSGAACLYRIVKTRSRIAIATALVLAIPGAAWCWVVLVTHASPSASITSILVLLWSILAVVLLVRGFHRNDWFETFSGLGALGIANAALIDESWFDGTSQSLGLSLLASVSGMVCLFGMLVDLELTLADISRSLTKVRFDLVSTKQQTDDLMHDLRGGLLSIEAATPDTPGEGGGLLKAEIARLRVLTRRDHEDPVSFDLVRPIEDLVNVRRSAGIEIDLRTPDRAVVSGCESQVLSIVQNLVENAERHGDGTISLQIEDDPRGLRIEVADTGPGLIGVDGQSIFNRGVTTNRTGLGIGLHVSRRLAKANGAELYYEADGSGHPRFVLAFSALASTRPAFAS